MIFLSQKFAPASLSIVQKVNGVIQLVLSKPVSLWHRLTMAERLYAIATLLLIFTSNMYGFIALIATIALSIEFWPIFTRMWHSLAGKAIILLFYAVIANFALVSASSVVNEVVGVSAESLTYTHNFAILLYLPIWLFSITVVVLALMQMGLPFYLLLLLVLKPFGMKGVRLVAKSDFPFLVGVIRLVMSFLVLFHLILLTDAESEFTDAKFDEVLKRNLGVKIQEGSNGQEVNLLLGEKLDSKEAVKELSQIQSTSQLSKNKTSVEDVRVPEISEPKLALDGESMPEVIAQVLSELDKAAQESAELNPSALEELEQTQAELTELDLEEQASVEKAAPTVSIVDRYLEFSKGLIAHFAFKLESDEYSRCEISNGANIIELNDYEILEITPDETKKYQYRFEVKKCVSPAFPSD